MEFYLFALQELEGSVAVAEEVRPSEHAAFFGRKLHSGKDLEQGQQLRPVLQIVGQAFDSQRGTPLKL